MGEMPRSCDVSNGFFTLKRQSHGIYGTGNSDVDGRNPANHVG